MHGLFLLRGKDHLTTDRIVAGDIGAVAKLSDTHTGTTLAPKGTPVRVAAARAAAGRLRAGPQAADPGRRRQAVGALQRLLTEDPGLASTATRRPARRCCAAAATRTSPSRWSGWPASSA